MKRISSELGMNIFVLKPDFVMRQLETVVRGILETHGFAVISQRTKTLNDEEVCFLYEWEFNRDFPFGAADIFAQPHISYMTSGPSIALLVLHHHAKGMELFQLSRELRGDHFLPRECKPGSIRYDLRDKHFDTQIYNRKDGFFLEPVPKNGIHCALNDEELRKCTILYYSQNEHISTQAQ